MPRSACVLLLLSWAYASVSACASAVTTSAPAATRPAAWPIAYRHEVRQDPRIHLHIVTIDLSDPRVELLAAPAGPDPDGADGPWQMTLNTVRETADAYGLDVAVNGNFFIARRALTVGGRRVPYFGGNWARAVGWLVSDGVVISGQPADASLVVDEGGRVVIGRFDRLPPGARQVVSGSQQILSGGRLTARDVAAVGDGPTGEPARAPRTAVGIDADGTTLVLLVVDGRRLAHSIGMSETELAREMRRLGCVDAINLDGGGSSTLVMRDRREDLSGRRPLRVLNRPSDGHDLPVPLSLERSVACVLGARVTREEREAREKPSTTEATTKPTSGPNRHNEK